MATSSTWLRRALLGGVALGVMATGAQADELTALKAQLDALQSRVNQLEASGSTGAAMPNLPDGASWITFHRGSDLGWDQSTFARPQEYMPESRGYTIAITPSADLPAPIMEVTVSGYVKGDFILHTAADLGDSFAASAIPVRGDDDIHVRLHAKQSRFRIQSRADTAIGQIRTLIEGDFFGGNGNELVSNSDHFRLRHAWGEWDVTPNTTLGIGQTWSNFINLFAYPDTVDFFGPVGIASYRQAQIRLTYHEGPWLFAVSVENPETFLAHNDVGGAPVIAGTCRESAGANLCGANDEFPDFTARFEYSAPGGHRFQVSGVVQDNSWNHGGPYAGNPNHGTGVIPGGDHDLGWAVMGAALINLGDIVSLALTGQYSDGARYLASSGGNPAGVVVFPGTPGFSAGEVNRIEQWGGTAALSFSVSDASTINLVGGYYGAEDNDLLSGMTEEMYTVHANWMWQPVDKMRFGWEVQYGHRTEHWDVGGDESGDSLGFQFGAWFFF